MTATCELELHKHGQNNIVFKLEIIERKCFGTCSWRDLERHLSNFVVTSCGRHGKLLTIIAHVDICNLYVQLLESMVNIVLNRDIFKRSAPIIDDILRGIWVLLGYNHVYNKSNADINNTLRYHLSMMYYLKCFDKNVKNEKPVRYLVAENITKKW